jgi:poly(3-hydroxybutyrate) depolymerase
MKETLSNVDRLAIELGHAGRNTLMYIDDDRNADRPFKLQTYRPYGYTPDRPVVFVLPDAQRNGDDFRDFWIPAADKHHLLIVAPTFPNDIWPGTENYANGRVFSAGGNPRHVDGWSYHLIGQILADIRTAEISEAEQAYLFGYGDGGEFVHRLLSSQSHSPFRAATSCASGWYTLPTLETPFPEGMGKVGLSDEHVVRLLAYPLNIMVSDQDESTEDTSLVAHTAALNQGASRLARAQHYFEAGQREALRRHVPFNWTLDVVSGSAHDARAMSALCARAWFEDAASSDATS